MKDWTTDDSRNAFLSKEADEAYDVFYEAFPEDPIPTLEEFIEWTMANNLAGATAACYYLASVAESRGLFERHSKNMNTKKSPKNPWSSA